MAISPSVSSRRWVMEETKLVDTLDVYSFKEIRIESGIHTYPGLELLSIIALMLL
jgi:hypothetical protein